MELVIENLSKTYPNGTEALKDVSLTIGHGMFGLLGPNGAGKSTLMRTISTLQEPDTGSIRLGELNVLTQKREVREVLGYLPQEFGVYPRISAEVLLDHLAVLKGVTNKKERSNLVDTLLHKTNLYNDRKKNLGGFSGGMKQRFGIAQALLTNPKLIIVDEPTAGLDPGERNRFLNLLSELGENTVVILSTHIVADVTELCPKMAIINKGQVLLTGNPADAIKRVEGKIWKKHIDKEAFGEYKNKYQVISHRLVGGNPEIRIYSDTNPGEGFATAVANLEDIYFSEIFNNAAIA